MSKLLEVILLSITMMYSISAFTLDFGKKMQILKFNGAHQLSIVYSDKDKEIMMLTFSFLGKSLSINSNQSQIIVYPSYIALVNKDSGEFLTSWVETDLGKQGFTPESEMGISVAGVKINNNSDLEGNINKLAIVISIKKANPASDLYIDLKEIYDSNPDSFINADSLK